MSRSRIAVIVLSLLLMCLYGCAESDDLNAGGNTPRANNTQQLSKIFNLSDWLVFLDADATDEILSSEESYFYKLRNLEKKYYFEGVVVAPDESNKIDYNHLARKWDIAEQDKILRIIFNFESEFSTYNCKFNESVPIMKILGHSRLPEVFALNSGVVVTEKALQMADDDLETELIKALFSYYLNNNIELRNKLIGAIGFTPLENLSVPEIFADSIVIRPELYQPYVIKAVRADIESAIEENWTPMSFIDPSDNRIRDYFVNVKLLSENKAIIDKVKNRNLYLEGLEFMKDYLAVPARVLKNADGVVGIDFKKYYGNDVQPEDILADAFEKIVQDRYDEDNFVIQALLNNLR